MVDKRNAKTDMKKIPVYLSKSPVKVEQNPSQSLLSHGGSSVYQPRKEANKVGIYGADKVESSILIHQVLFLGCSLM